VLRPSVSRATERCVSIENENQSGSDIFREVECRKKRSCDKERTPANAREGNGRGIQEKSAQLP